MKVMIALVVLGLQLTLHADYLMWMVGDPTIEIGGSPYTVWSEIPGPDGATRKLNGARVAAKDAAGNVSYLAVSETGDFDPDNTLVKLNAEEPAVLPLWAQFAPSGYEGWSMAIELGTYELGLDETLIWSTVATSGFTAAADLVAFMAQNVKDMPGFTPWMPTAYVAPEPSSGLLLVLGCAVLALRRRRIRVDGRNVRALTMTAGALALGSATAAPVVSSNIHGLVRIDPATTNTIISVPWVGYTADGKPTTELPANRLVSPRGLVAGDLLMQVSDEVAYAAWTLTENAETGARTWEPMMTASRGSDDFGKTRNEILTHDGRGTVPRGRGIWLVRHRPLQADGTPNPVFLYGQWTTAAKVVEIPGVVRGKTKTYGGYDACTYTMLANPDCTSETVINEMAWDSELVGATDTIVIPTDHAATRVLFWEEPSDAAPNGRWYYTKTVKVNKYVSQTVKAHDASVPAGVGFWYVRRAADPLYVRWAEKGE